MRLKNSRLWVPACGVAAVLSCLPETVHAAVVEPNGLAVPGPPNTDGELPLQAFFDAEGEAIDALNAAASEPGLFSPLCEFQAALVLSQSQAKAGIAWYNADPDDPPSPQPLPAPQALFPIVGEDAAVGAVISSADIRTSAGYAGGLIGFALTKQGQAVYYSEHRRNAFCTRCELPDFWKMALIYQSTTAADSYYLAFEDWEGANDETWFGNDGDFNDKVFRISGVSCAGGGQPCDTGLAGLCAVGVTQCQFGGALQCKSQLQPVAEVCDGLDNDCDGTVDTGPLCDSDEVCDKGQCVPRCGEVVWTCQDDEICNAAGFCVDASCADVECASGERCVAGICETPCAGIVCPASQVCLAGQCADPCQGVACDEGSVCQAGACVASCSCSACAANQECADSGQCVPNGCATQSCAVGMVCEAGACVDPCQGAVCPRGQRCSEGSCVDACVGVTCASGEKCVAGSCVDACAGINCGPGFVCIAGDAGTTQCVDKCADVLCVTGQLCQNGLCVVSGSSSGGSSSEAGPGTPNAVPAASSQTGASTAAPPSADSAAGGLASDSPATTPATPPGASGMDAQGSSDFAPGGAPAVPPGADPASPPESGGTPQSAAVGAPLPSAPGCACAVIGGAAVPARPRAAWSWLAFGAAVWQLLRRARGGVWS